MRVLIAFVIFWTLLLTAVGFSEIHAGYDHSPSFEPKESNMVDTEKFSKSDLNVFYKYDRVKGLNLGINISNFTFSPNQVNRYHRDGYGHAHIYINGEKHDRMYSRYYYIQNLPDEKFNLTVSINANDHRVYRNEQPIVKTFEIYPPS